METMCWFAVGFIHNKSGLSRVTIKFGVVIVHHSFGPVNPDMRGITVCPHYTTTQDKYLFEQVCVCVCVYLLAFYGKWSQAQGVPSLFLVVSNLGLNPWIFFAFVTTLSSLFHASTILWRSYSSNFFQNHIPFKNFLPYPFVSFVS